MTQNPYWTAHGFHFASSLQYCQKTIVPSLEYANYPLPDCQRVRTIIFLLEKLLSGLETDRINRGCALLPAIRSRC